MGTGDEAVDISGPSNPTESWRNRSVGLTVQISTANNTGPITYPVNILL